jgi:hypothetical protein
LRPVLILMLLVMLPAASAIVPSPAPLAVLLILSWSHEHRFLALIQSRLTLRCRLACRTLAACKAVRLMELSVKTGAPGRTPK